MRGKWNHQAPENHQPEPADNTSKYVRRQVNQWNDSKLQAPAVALIHPETAMAIAAYWQSPGGDGIAFAEFASTGTISFGLIPAIERILGLTNGRTGRDLSTDVYFQRLELFALKAYVRACPGLPMDTPEDTRVVNTGDYNPYHNGVGVLRHINPQNGTAVVNIDGVGNVYSHVSRVRLAE